MRKYVMILLFFMCIMLPGCASLQKPTVLKNGNISNYQYVLINPTMTLTSSTDMLYNGFYLSEDRSVNPKDIISGFLAKKGFIIINETQDDLLNKTLIVTYGESGRRDLAFGYTTEVTIQFITPDTKQLMFSCTAEGIGDTEADDIKIAINRALSSLFIE